MGVSGRTSKVPSVIAALCIVVYIAAIAFGAVRIIVNIGERRNLAENEFYDLADRASSSAVFLGFMSGAYQETIKDFLSASETLLGVIITGSGNEYAFERYPGGGVVWAGESPRLKIGFGLLNKYQPLRIDGQRNVTIQVVYNCLNYDSLVRILRDTLLAILAALAAAFITLMVELMQKNNAVYRAAAPADSASAKTSAKTSAKPAVKPAAKKPAKPPAEPVRESPRQEEPAETIRSADLTTEETGEPSSTEFSDFYEPNDDPFEEPVGDLSFDLPFEDEDEEASFEEANEEVPLESPDKDERGDSPQGLFTPRGNVGWESYINDRLASEIHRCSSFEQDLVFMVMEFSGDEELGDVLYRQFTDEAVSFFAMRDLIFEKGERGISVIIPSVNLEQGIAKAEEFRRRIIDKLSESLGGLELRIGLSSRTGRLIEADRLMLEASTALEKALDDPLSPIVAFKSDPEKYREFIKGRV